MPHPTLRWLAAGLSLFTLVSCSSDTTPSPPQEPPVDMGPILDATAESYVKLVLAVGQHDPDYVDAFYGPSAWREEAEVFRKPLDEISTQADTLLAEISSPITAAEKTELEKTGPGSTDSEDTVSEHGLLEARRRFLVRQLEALQARVALLSGEKRSFDEESQALYDAVAPKHEDSEFESVLQQLDAILRAQGFSDGSLIERYEAFRKDFIIPPDKVDEVFQTAIDACRERTEAYIDLPEDENFEVEYVTDKPWSGYNWYQGGYYSLIQVNTDLPIYIDRALDLACHEGYPGHHVFNSLLEKRLVNQRGWIEYTVYPLFSPQSLIAEGSANYGIEIAFPGQARRAFEEEVLFPLAGLDPSKTDVYYDVLALLDQLKYADNEAARRYLDGEIDAEAAAEWLTRYAANTPARAEQRLKFIDKYRSYVINYNLGEDLVRGYVQRETDARQADSPWPVFAELLSTPSLPSDLL